MAVPFGHSLPTLQQRKEGITMLQAYLDDIRSDLFSGEIVPCDYDRLVRTVLRSALDSQCITYTEWSRLYYEYIG